jgi:UDP-galactopyranose mutase
LHPEEVPAFLESKRGHYNPPRNFEEKIINAIGEELYEGFVKGYTTKQWGVNPSALPAELKFRVPIRPNANEDYFDDPYQGIPRGGYTLVFEKMLGDVDVELNTDFLKDREYWQKKAKRLVYTGPLDRYFDFRYKALSWRGIHFAMETIKTNMINEVAVINIQDVDIPFSRIAELKHLHPETVPNTGTTILLKEMLDDPPSSEEAYSRDWILKPQYSQSDRQIFEKYRQLSKRERNVFFGGRIADYQYYDMDQVIGLALRASKVIVKSL